MRRTTAQWWRWWWSAFLFLPPLPFTFRFLSLYRVNLNTNPPYSSHQLHPTPQIIFIVSQCSKEKWFIVKNYIAYKMIALADSAASNRLVFLLRLASSSHHHLFNKLPPLLLLSLYQNERHSFTHLHKIITRSLFSSQQLSHLPIIIIFSLYITVFRTKTTQGTVYQLKNHHHVCCFLLFSLPKEILGENTHKTSRDKK